MVDVEQDQLVLACEGAVQWGMGHPVLMRTLELYQNQTMYCFEEPRNSMQKALREKVYLHGCRVVDCGMVGLTEVLALFLWDYEYLERVDRLGNRAGLEFRPALPRGQFASTWWSPSSAIAAAGYQMARRCFGGSDRPSHPHSVMIEPGGTPAAVRGGERERDSTDLSPDDQRRASSGIDARVPSEETWAEFCRGDYMVLLYLPSKALKWSWLKAVRRASGSYGIPTIHSYGENNVAGDAVAAVGEEGEQEKLRLAVVQATQGRLRRSPLYASLSEATNQVCADCGAPHPTWSVLHPFGVFTCIDCIGVHRQLWANKCREVELDHWPAEDVAYMQRRGNAIANAELEYGFRGITHGALKDVKPTPSSTIFEREAYIYQKYVERQFCKENTEETPFLLVTEMEQRSAVAASTTSSGLLSKTPNHHPSSSPPPRRHGASPTSGNIPATHGLLGFPALGPTPFPERMGPPRYSGVAILVVQELSACFGPPVTRGVLPYLREGLVCVLTNGYQELRTQKATRPPSAGGSGTVGSAVVSRPVACWNETMQLGIEDVSQPLSLSVFTCRRRKRRLLAAGEFFLDRAMIQASEPQERRRSEMRASSAARATSPSFAARGEVSVAATQENGVGRMKEVEEDGDAGATSPGLTAGDVDDLVSGPPPVSSLSPLEKSLRHDVNEDDDDNVVVMESTDHHHHVDHELEENAEGEEDGGGGMEPLTVHLRWCHLNHPVRPRPYDTWTVSLLATYCSYA